MKLTAGELMDARPALTELAQQKWPIVVAYRLAKLIREMDRELEPVEKVRGDLIRELGTQEGMAHTVKPDSPNFPVFIEKLNELRVQPIVLAQAPVVLEIVGSAPVTVVQMLQLGDLVTIVEPVESQPAAQTAPASAPGAGSPVAANLRPVSAEPAP